MNTHSGQIPPVPSDLPGSRPLFAMSLRLLAMVATSIMFAGVKYISDRNVSIFEILLFRQFFSLPVVLLAMALGLVSGGWRTSRLNMHFSRSAIGMGSMLLTFLSFILLPLSEATTIAFSAPIFATVISALILREHVGFHRWAAVLIGFLGVLIIVNPGHHLDMPLVGVAVSIAAAVSISIVSILVREISRTEEPGTTVLYFSALPVLPLAMLMPFVAHLHDRETYLMLAALGMIGGLAQMLLTTSLRYGPISVVLPMDYSSLLWTALISWLVWNQLPAPTTAVGAVFIIGSGIYIAWRERKHNLPASPGVAAAID